MNRFFFSILLFFLLSFCLWQDASICLAEASGIDLHAHLFMKEGMGWAFRGGFNDPLQADSWENRFSSQINPETLEKSQLDLVVATLYAHPLFTLSLRDSIRSQIRMAREFVTQHPNWVLATSASSAAKAFRQGKKIMILGLEGASGILESEDDLVEFIDQGGIRIVTFLHLTDDSLGGVAFLKGFRAISSPLSLLKSFWTSVFDSEGVRLNSQGLTLKGKKLAEALVRRKVWLDLAHSSDRSQNDLFPILANAKQPHLYTHTTLRKHLAAERGISLDQLRQVAETHGMIGLIPSEEMLEGTPSSDSCPGGIGAFITQIREIGEKIGFTSMSMGSDFNGGLPHLKPFCHTGTSLKQEGLWNIGQSGELWEILLSELPKTPPHAHTLQFLKTWALLD